MKETLGEISADFCSNPDTDTTQNIIYQGG